MSKLLEQIRTSRLAARKYVMDPANKLKSDTSLFHAEARSNIFGTLIGAVESKSKAKGAGEITDEMVIAEMKILMKGIDASIASMVADARPEQEQAKFFREAEALKEFMPTQITRAIVLDHCMKQPDEANFAMLMKSLKETYPGQVDGAMAAEAIKAYVEERKRKTL